MELEAMNTTSTYIGDTLFIVESVTADSAKETATDKVKRLILCNLDEMLYMTIENSVKRQLKNQSMKNIML